MSVFAPKSDQVLDQSGTEPMNPFMVKYNLIYLPVFAVRANKLLRHSEAESNNPFMMKYETS